MLFKRRKPGDQELIAALNATQERIQEKWQRVGEIMDRLKARGLLEEADLSQWSDNGTRARADLVIAATRTLDELTPKH